jgi:hypothetical protein
MLTPAPTINTATSPDHVLRYANSVNIGFSLWDARLEFGILSQGPTPDQLTVEKHTTIYLSPQQTKALLNVLQANMATYERNFGPIKLEPVGGAAPGDVN